MILQILAWTKSRERSGSLNKDGNTCCPWRGVKLQLGTSVGVLSDPRKGPGTVSSLSSLGSVFTKRCSEEGCSCPWIRAVCCESFFS